MEGSRSISSACGKHIYRESIYPTCSALHRRIIGKSLPLEEEKIRSIILSFPEITSPHHLRTRHIGNNIAIEVHIRMDGKNDFERCS